MYVLTLLFFISNDQKNGLNMDFNSLKKQKVLQKLKCNKDIVITHPDKANGVVTLNRDEYLNPIQDGPFQGCSRMGGGLFGPLLPKIRHTYPKMMKLGSYTLPKGDPKNVQIT